MLRMSDLSSSYRRGFLQAFGSAFVAYPLGQFGITSSAIAQEVAKTAADPAIAPLNRFPRMMQEWLVDQVRASEQRGNDARAALKTKADAEAYVKTVREKIMQCFGPFPEKTPLNAKVAKVVERDTYRIENVIFESRPGFLVTANVYVPKGRKAPMPGVVGSCGHSTNGKAAEAYQSFAQGLARQGYVCLIFDPIGQGERFQYIGEVKGKGLMPRYGAGVSEHIQAGNQQVLVGESLAAWRAWDGIRALDYLLTREEVDPKHVGITGNSGGGTMTTWLCGVEQRWTMAAPACFVTTFRRNAENELPADTEQCPPRVLALDLDHADFIAAMAPKPVVLVTQEKDFFDVRGSEEAFAKLKNLYALLGAPDNIRLHTGTEYHGYTQVNREAMYQWFNKVTGVSDAQKEPEIVIEKDETLWCTPKGQVSQLGSRTVSSFTREKADALSKHLYSQKAASASLDRLVRNALKMPLLEGVPDYRILRTAGTRKYPAKGFCTYAVETEPGAQAILTRLFNAALISRLPRGQKRAVLYISHRSSDAELRDEPLIADLIKAEPDSAFFACDVRGIGDSQPNTCGVDQALKPYGNHYFYAAHGVMMDRPLLGQRTFDVLRVIALLAANGHEEIHLAGRGWGAQPATFAALLSDRVKQVTLKNAPVSFHDIATNEDYKWPYAALLPNALELFDLPQCYHALKSKKLVNMEVWTAADGMNP
jgi:dienelactone hydrolase/pimeloyl-ACP methyl ester carboxylesterase